MRPLATACAAALLALAACGGASDDAQVRETVKRFGDATAKRDYAALCDDVLSRQLVTRIASIGLPCEDALAQGLKEVRRPRLEVRRVRIRDKLALVEVTSGATGQRGSLDVLRLVHDDDGWRIASLSGAQPPAPERHP